VNLTKKQPGWGADGMGVKQRAGRSSPTGSNQRTSAFNGAFG